jgi:CyaY protein
MSTELDRKEFARRSASALALLDDALGDVHDDLDVDLAGDVLTLAFSDGGRFIINAHSAAGQVWMAAGTTAWHFDWIAAGEEGRWVASRTDEELFSTVARVVGDKLGTPLEISAAD